MNNRNLEKARGGGLKSHNFAIYSKIFSLDNLFSAWDEFRHGKERKLDVQEFALNLEDNIFALHQQLVNVSYQHSAYQAFYVHDPKRRHIFKAPVRDRVLHHAIVRVIGKFFEKSFIFDSYSSRFGKGTHRAVKRLRYFAWKLSRNNTRTVWALQCDIKKYFDTVNHKQLITLLKLKIDDYRVVELLGAIINSLEITPGNGIPLGNLTSQLFSNIYLDCLDQQIKRGWAVKYYLRYNDDFVILSANREYLEKLIPVISRFLSEKLCLKLHAQKISIKSWQQGIDWLGYVSFPYHTILRTRTKRRILRRVTAANRSSYLGVLSHCRSRGIRTIIQSCLTRPIA